MVRLVDADVESSHDKHLVGSILPSTSYCLRNCMHVLKLGKLRRRMCWWDGREGVDMVARIQMVCGHWWLSRKIVCENPNRSRVGFPMLRFISIQIPPAVQHSLRSHKKFLIIKRSEESFFFCDLRGGGEAKLLTFVCLHATNKPKPLLFIGASGGFLCWGSVSNSRVHIRDNGDRRRRCIPIICLHTHHYILFGPWWCAGGRRECLSPSPWRLGERDGENDGQDGLLWTRKASVQCLPSLLVDELLHSRALEGVHGCHGSQNAGL